MRYRIVNPYLLIGLTGISATRPTLFTHVYRAFWAERNIRWTPPGMSLLAWS